MSTNKIEFKISTPSPVREEEKKVEKSSPSKISFSSSASAEEVVEELVSKSDQQNISTVAKINNDSSLPSDLAEIGRLNIDSIDSSKVDNNGLSSSDVAIKSIEGVSKQSEDKLKSLFISMKSVVEDSKTTMISLEALGLYKVVESVLTQVKQIKQGIGLSSNLIENDIYEFIKSNHNSSEDIKDFSKLRIMKELVYKFETNEVKARSIISFIENECRRKSVLKNINRLNKDLNYLFSNRNEEGLISLISLVVESINDILVNILFKNKNINEYSETVFKIINLSEAIIGSSKIDQDSFESYLSDLEFFIDKYGTRTANTDNFISNIKTSFNSSKSSKDSSDFLSKMVFISDDELEFDKDSEDNLIQNWIQKVRDSEKSYKGGFLTNKKGKNIVVSYSESNDEDFFIINENGISKKSPAFIKPDDEFISIEFKV